MRKRGYIILSCVVVLGVVAFGISSCTNKKAEANTSVEVITEEPTTEVETEKETEPATTEVTEETEPSIDREAIIDEWSSTDTSLSDLERELKSHNVNGSDINEIIETISTNREHLTQESLPAPTEPIKVKETQAPTKAPASTKAPTQAPKQTEAPSTQPQTEALTLPPETEPPTAPPTEALTVPLETEAPTEASRSYYNEDGSPNAADIYAGLLAGDPAASEAANDDRLDHGGASGNHDWN